MVNVMIKVDKPKNGARYVWVTINTIQHLIHLDETREIKIAITDDEIRTERERLIGLANTYTHKH